MNGRFPKPVTTTLVLTSAFWLFMLWQQSAFVLHSLQSPPDHPTVARFAQRYIVTSSAELAAFLFAALAFGTLLYWLRASWAAAALTLISILAVWRYFLAGTSILFRPPLGDGTLGGAFAAQSRLVSERWFSFSVQTVLLFALVILWVICFCRLYAANRNA
ncbi:MAG: hypothetical protein ACR2OZ_12015 [Verrucomicrobiales bacterium]